jgi:hypothetical protein
LPKINQIPKKSPGETFLRFSHREHRGHSAASGFALGRNQNIKDRLLQIRRMFFAFAFLFAASAFGEGGEKRTTAKNRKLI